MILEITDYVVILTALLRDTRCVSYLDDQWVEEIQEMGLFDMVHGVTAKGRDLLTTASLQRE
jgi:hypothetical protein